jgi:hypothetical protein
VQTFSVKTGGIHSYHCGLNGYPFKDETFDKDPVRTAPQTLLISIIKTNHLVLYRTKVAVLFCGSTVHKTLCEQNGQFLGAFKKSRKATVSFVVSVSAGNNSAPPERICMKLYI